MNSALAASSTIVVVMLRMCLRCTCGIGINLGRIRRKKSRRDGETIIPHSRRRSCAPAEKHRSEKQKGDEDKRKERWTAWRRRKSRGIDLDSGAMA